MRNKLFAVLATLAVALVLGTSSARADNWDFSTIGAANSNVGHSGTVTSGSLTITIYAFWSGGADADIYNKAAGVDETGLGVSGDQLGDNEISSNDFLTFDMSALSGQGINSGWFTIGSVQAGESFQVCTGSSLGSLGDCSSAVVGDGSNSGQVQVFVQWSSDDPFVSITGVQNDVLVASNFSTVPEPGTLTLLGTGLLGMAGFLRRKIGV